MFPRIQKNELLTGAVYVRKGTRCNDTPSLRHLRSEEFTVPSGVRRPASLQGKMAPASTRRRHNKGVLGENGLQQTGEKNAESAPESITSVVPTPIRLICWILLSTLSTCTLQQAKQQTIIGSLPFEAAATHFRLPACTHCTLSTVGRG